MLKQRYWFVITVLIVILVASGCQGNSESAELNNTPPNAVSSDTEAIEAIDLQLSDLDNVQIDLGDLVELDELNSLDQNLIDQNYLQELTDDLEQMEKELNDLDNELKILDDLNKLDELGQ